jgi:hypothetical protein
MKRIVVHIDRLILRGFRRQDRHEIAGGLQQELARTLATSRPASLTRLPDLALVRPDNVRITQHANARGIGRAVARSIDGGLRK